jgi:hypothetical protein
MHSWNTFNAWTNHGQTQIHKTHHGLNLGEAITFPLIIFFVPSHGANTQKSFCPRTLNLRVSKFLKFRLPRLWRPITFCSNLWLRWYLKQSCSLCWQLSNDILHATWTQVHQGDFQLLVVRNQIVSLILGPFFAHNLCFKYPIGHVSLIYTSML